MKSYHLTCNPLRKIFKISAIRNFSFSVKFCLLLTCFQILISQPLQADNPNAADTLVLNFSFVDKEFKRGESVLVALTVKNFKGVVSLQYGVRYETKSLVFQEISFLNYKLPNLTFASVANDTVNSLVRFVWNTPNVFTGEQLTDGDTLMVIKFLAACPGGDVFISNFNRRFLPDEAVSGSGDYIPVKFTSTAPFIRIDGQSNDEAKISHELIPNTEFSSFKIKIRSENGKNFNHLRVLGLQNDSIIILGGFERDGSWLSNWIKCNSKYRFVLQDAECCYLEAFGGKLPDCITQSGYIESSEIDFYFYNNKIILNSKIAVELKDAHLVGMDGKIIPLHTEAKKLNAGENYLPVIGLKAGTYILQANVNGEMYRRKVYLVD